MIRLSDIYPQYITDEKGKKKSVILSISKFQELIEDIEDLAAVVERKNEPTISHKNFPAELKNDGLNKIEWKQSAYSRKGSKT